MAPRHPGLRSPSTSLPLLPRLGGVAAPGDCRKSQAGGFLRRTPSGAKGQQGLPADVQGPRAELGALRTQLACPDGPRPPGWGPCHSDSSWGSTPQSPCAGLLSSALPRAGARHTPSSGARAARREPDAPRGAGRSGDHGRVVGSRHRPAPLSLPLASSPHPWAPRCGHRPRSAGTQPGSPGGGMRTCAQWPLTFPAGGRRPGTEGGRVARRPAPPSLPARSSGFPPPSGFREANLCVCGRVRAGWAVSCYLLWLPTPRRRKGKDLDLEPSPLPG